MRRLRGIRLESVKDYVQIGVGFTAILGGLITAGAVVFGGGDSESPAALATNPSAPTATVAAPANTAPLAAETPLPTATSLPTSTPEPAGQFLRVQFGTQQDPNTLLPAGATSGPNGDVQACPGDTLYAWVEHTFRNGDVLTGRLSSRSGTLYSASVPVDERSPNFWIGAQVSDAGIHTLSLALEGGRQSGEWNINVTC